MRSCFDIDIDYNKCIEQTTTSWLTLPSPLK